MQNKINIIFDFDGTLVNSCDLIIEKFNLLADEFHFNKCDTENIAQLRDLTSKELITHFNIPLYKIPRIIFKARQQMSTEMKFIPPIPHLVAVIQEMYNMNINLGMLTSNSLNNVSEWLQLHHMRHFFNFIHTESSYLGKKRSLNKIIKMYEIQRAHTFYIGDETRDIEAAKKCGIHSIAVAWGFNSEKILTQCRPDYLAREPDDLLAIIMPWLKN